MCFQSPTASEHRRQVLFNLLLAVAAASAFAAAKWLFPALGVPGWLPSLVFSGLIFLNPLRVLRRPVTRRQLAMRLVMALGVAALFHFIVHLMFETGAGNLLFPLVIPLLLAPIFLRPIDMRQLLGGNSSLRSFFRKALG